MSTRRFHNIVFAIAAIVFAVTAVNSVGFHHFDEHCQILEFACIKLGMGTGSDLAWEYPAQIRPALQPAIVVVLAKVLSAIGITSTFTWALVLRLLTALFTICSIYFSVSTLQRALQKENKKAFILLSYFLYFIPYIAVRYSSETTSAVCFLLAFSIIHRFYDSPKGLTYPVCIAAGLLMGLSFEFRFQSAFLAFGLMCWLLFIHKLPMKKMAVLCIGIAVMVVIGTAIDAWFYGNIVFTPWNYFAVNILQDKASSFGVEPWYYYAVGLSTPGISSFIKLLVLIAAFIFLVKNHRNIVTLTILPFIVVHVLIAHKEMRFMIPIAFFLSYTLVFTWQQLVDIIKSSTTIGILKLVLVQAVFINVIALAVFMVKPADGQPLVYEYLSKRYGNAPLTVYSINEVNDFYGAQATLPMNFYEPPAYKIVQLRKQNLFALIDSIGTENIVLVANGYTDMNKQPVTPIYATQAPWLKRLDKNGWMKIKNADRIIYKLNSERSSEIRSAWYPPMALPVIVPTDI